MRGVLGAGPLYYTAPLVQVANLEPRVDPRLLEHRAPFLPERALLRGRTPGGGSTNGDRCLIEECFDWPHVVRIGPAVIPPAAAFPRASPAGQGAALAATEGELGCGVLM